MTEIRIRRVVARVRQAPASGAELRRELTRAVGRELRAAASGRSAAVPASAPVTSIARRIASEIRRRTETTEVMR